MEKISRNVTSIFDVTSIFATQTLTAEKQLTDEQTGAPAFGYPAKDQRELAADCRRLKSMLVPDKRPLPEISSCANAAW